MDNVQPLPILKILELDEQWKKRVSPPSVDMKLLKFVFLGASRPALKVWDPQEIKSCRKKMSELQIWVQLISIDPLVDLVVEHGNGKLLTFSGENHPKNGWFHRRRIPKVQASRRSRWNPNLRNHPSYPQIKHPMWGPKMNQSTPPKKRLLGVDIGMESMAFFVEPTSTLKYPNNIRNLHPLSPRILLLGWKILKKETYGSHIWSPVVTGPVPQTISNCWGLKWLKKVRRPPQPAESLESLLDIVGRCQDWEIPSGEFLVVARWSPFFCWWFMWFTMFAGEIHVC